MIFLLFFRISLSSASAVMTVPDQKFTPSCLNENVPSVVMYFFIMGEFIMQGTILGLTFFKHFIAVRAGWARTPLVSLLRRDGATTFTVITAVLICTVIYGRFEYMHDSAHFVFPAFVSILSCVGCRLIISMQKLVTPDFQEHSATQDSQEFTTIVHSLWTGVPSAQTPSDSILTRIRMPSGQTPSAISIA